MKLYHGSNQIVNKPQYGHKSEISDYGDGFYLTENLELAKEWATKHSDKKGYVNVYDFDNRNLKILDLTSKQYNSLHWIAILINNRSFTNSSLVVKNAKDYLLNKYLIDFSQYDVVIGYRADDSYFAFVKAFLRNEIGIEQLETAIKIGNLGIQYFIKSQKAFEKLVYVDNISVDVKQYIKKRLLREFKGRKVYFDMIKKELPKKTILEIIKNDY